MGHQFRYYMTPKDTQEVEQTLLSRVPLAIITRKSFSEKPRVIDSLFFDESDSWPFSLALVRPEDVDQVVMRHVPAQGYWVADVLGSPIIEFDRCRLDGKTLQLARMYYVDGLYGKDDVWIEKSDDFKTFAKKVFSTTKRSLARRDTNYIGADAQAWADAGGTLVESIVNGRVFTEPARIPRK